MNFHDLSHEEERTNWLTVGILEHAEFAPWLLLRLSNEDNATRFELPIGCRDVITSKRTVKKCPDPILMPFRCKEHHSRCGVSDSKLNPALFIAKRLIR